MSTKEEDLERAGTRSRRQLSGITKKSSIYPPPPSSSSSLESHFHPNTKRKQHSSRSKWIIVMTCSFIVILFITFTFNVTDFNASIRKRRGNSYYPTLVQFNDSSQYTDYTLLTKLLTGSTADKPSKIASLQHQFNPSPFSLALSRGSVTGHTFDQLRRLTNRVNLPDTTSKSNGKRVPVTAIIHANTVTQLYTQLQSVLTQTALPEHIWIICDTMTQHEVSARIMTLDRRRVKIMALDTEDWFKIVKHVATQYVWLIDQDVAPGKRYLENILKLLNTQQYANALLGTEAIMVGDGEDVECIPHTMHSKSAQMKSHGVDAILDSWVLQKNWLKVLMDSYYEDSSSIKLGLFISKTLYMNGGIPSIAIPSDPIERAYWGDVRLSKAHKTSTCKALEHVVELKKGMGYRVVAEQLEDNQTTAESVAFYVDSDQDFNMLKPLICKFRAKEDALLQLHVLARTHVPELKTDYCHNNEIENSSNEQDQQQQFINVNIHNLNMLKSSSSGNIEPSDLIYGLTPLVNLIQPNIIIYTTEDENESFISIALQTLGKFMHTPVIYLPFDDIPHVSWMTELPATTLAKWNDFSIKLFINTDKKTGSLARLLSSISSAYTLGDAVDLTILMDQTTDRITQTFANDFLWKNKGNKYLCHRIAQVFKTPLFSESWYPTHNDEYGIILNNDVEVSKYYYIWAKYTILKYRYMERNDALFGISFYAPQILETQKSGRSLHHVGEEEEDAYAMQLPNPTGAIYFPEHWREFHDYITARLADIRGFGMQEKELVPALKSSKWTQSWRKYFEELVYLRGYVMLYPKISLCTQHVELKKKKLAEEYADAISLFNVPLLDDDIMDDLPLFENLPVLDIWGNKSSLEELKARGDELHRKTSSCAVLEEYTFDPTDLLCPFARVVSVTLENEQDPLPHLSTLPVTVYSRT